LTTTRRLSSLLTFGATLVLVAACSSPASSGAPAGSGGTGAGGWTPPAELLSAAKGEGTLNTIALPRDWCNYGELLDTFKSKTGLAINEITPNAGSAQEIDAIKNNPNGGPAAPDVVDVGAPEVVEVVSPGGRLDVVVVETGPHVGSPVGSGGAPLFTAHVMTTCSPGVYVTTARWSFGTPRLLGPNRLGRSNALWIRTSSSRVGFVVVVVDWGTVEVGVVGAVVG